MLLLVNGCWFILTCLFWQRTKKAPKEGYVRLMSPPAPIGSLALLKWVLLLQSNSISFRFAVQQAPNSTGDWSNSRCLQKTKRKHFVQTCERTHQHPRSPLTVLRCPSYFCSLLVSDLSCLRSLQLKKKKGASLSRPPAFTIRLLQPLALVWWPGPIRPGWGPGAKRRVCFYSTACDPVLLLGFFCPQVMCRWARHLISAAAVWKQIVSNRRMQPPQGAATEPISSTSFNRLLAYKEGLRNWVGCFFFFIL